ncbi:hypothetical protein Mal35_26510 [Gimesia maris]|uniref:hypothetical protein n=1 Tax=Gimesia maris TaxID=122 RepID=UPI00118788DD|nr:hypothetical protein [Gimesia maris]QDT79196.1 hypothetical protein Mal35_26510 [Gimesia maris]
MYSEIKEFLSSALCDRALWKDGEFWTALGVGIGTGCWCFVDSSAIPGIRTHFGDLLSVTSIVFGFVLTTLFFYVQAAGSWADDPRVARVAERLVDWHVWSIFCLLFQIGFILILWAFAKPNIMSQAWLSVCYGFLGFLVSYSGFQILNHTLTVRWSFRRRHHLQTGRPPRMNNLDLDADDGETTE